MEGTRVWVLADDRAGNVAQCLGVAEALGLPFERKDIAYGRWARLPNAARGASLVGVSAGSRAALAPPWPEVVIAAGRRTAPVARWIKKRSGGRTLLVQIMDPQWGWGDFDLLVIPSHDRTAPAGPNVLRVCGAPHRATPERLATAAEAWKDRVAHLPHPRIAVLVGGSSKDGAFTEAMAARLGVGVSGLAVRAGGSLMVTTSRRTGEQTRPLLGALSGAVVAHDWTKGGENPYFAFLALADAVVVTGDSVSMVSEACASPGPVLVYAPDGLVSEKHRRLHAELEERGLIRVLPDDPADWRLDAPRHTPHNPAADVAAAVRRMLEEARA